MNGLARLIGDARKRGDVRAYGRATRKPRAKRIRTEMLERTRWYPR